MNWDAAFSSPLHDIPLVFVDVETTGLRPERGDRVCEVGLAVYRGETEVLRFSSLVNPQRPISPGAAAVNGLTDAELADAPTFAAIAPQVTTALALGVPVAHNAPFDLAFLGHELGLAGAPIPEMPAIDTLALSRRLLPYRRHSLAELAWHFGILPSGRTHRALSDALTTRQLLRKLCQTARLPAQTPLAELFVLQGGPSHWPIPAAEQTVPLPPDMAQVIRAGRPLHLTYLAGDGRCSRRTVQPLHVLDSDGALYLVAFCTLRQAERTFRLDRIIAWEPA
ncbi:MAG: exonuclease domain-containing protein [Dehalococcoidales bacterium]|nr:exonuclease domain-containing protein [Dehalococcoidales bacterium]